MNTNRFKIITLLGIVSTIFISCTELRYTTLDVLRPAKIAFPGNVKNLLIVNNASIKHSKVIPQNFFANGRMKQENVVTDSLPIFCLASLKEEMEAKHFFDYIEFQPNVNDTSLVKGEELTPEQITRFCKESQCDAVLSLTKMAISDNIYDFQPSILENIFYSTQEIRYETRWSLYTPGQNTYKSIMFRDTVYWESDLSYKLQVARSQLPNRNDALIDGALYTGQHSVDRFIPYWEKVDRYFFHPRVKKMEQAMDSIYVRNWSAAISIWKEIIENSKNPHRKAQAANNAAIAYEITGDIDSAIEYATMAYYSYNMSNFTNYLTSNRLAMYVSELTNRKREIKKIKEQLSDK